MERPVSVALAPSVVRLPRDHGWWYKPRFDGDRAVMFRATSTLTRGAPRRVGTPSAARH